MCLEGTIQLGHGRQVEGFGTCLLGDSRRPCLREGLGRGIRRRVDYAFAASCASALKSTAAKCIEAGKAIDAELGEARSELKAQYGGINVGLRREGRRRKGKERIHLRIHLRGSGEQPVVANAGRGGDTVRDLALHHQDGTCDEAHRTRGKEFEQDVGGNVVGQIADNVGGLANRGAEGALRSA